MEMTIIIDGCTFTKKIGEHNIYSEEYGTYIRGTERANDFASMLAISSDWLEDQY